jgi:hypothetical protein
MSDSVKESLAGASSAALEAAAFADGAPACRPDRTYSSRRKVADRFGVTTRTVRRWEKIRGFPKVRYFNKRGYFDDEVLAAYEKQHFKATAGLENSAPLETERVADAAT